MINTAIINTQDAATASNTLKEVVSRLRAKGADRPAQRLQRVIDALEQSDTIHVSDGAGRA